MKINQHRYQIQLFKSKFFIVYQFFFYKLFNALIISFPTSSIEMSFDLVKLTSKMDHVYIQFFFMYMYCIFNHLSSLFARILSSIYAKNIFIFIHEKSRITTKKHLSLDVNIFKKVGTNIQTWGAFEPGPAVHHTGGDIWWHNSLSLTNVECTRSQVYAKRTLYKLHDKNYVKTL